jgi:hypothetical protein
MRGPITKVPFLIEAWCQDRWLALAMRDNVTLDPKWKRDLCVGAGERVGHLSNKCQQIRVQLSSFASHIFYRLATFPRIPSSANWLRPDFLD